jgi:hypothetical protein
VVKSRLKPGPRFQTRPSVESHRMDACHPPATACGTCEMLPAQQLIRAPVPRGITGGWVMWQVPKFQIPRREAGAQYIHTVFTDSLGTVRHQVTLLKPRFPDASQGWALSLPFTAARMASQFFSAQVGSLASIRTLEMKDLSHRNIQ